MTTSIYIGTELLKKIKDRADKEDRSVSKMITILLIKALTD